MKKPNITTEYTHRNGRIVISTGIGDGLYGAYIRKDNGSLKRFIPILPNKNSEVICLQLERYAAKKNSSIKKGLPIDPALNVTHLNAGMMVAACGVQTYNKPETVFLSQVTCEACKASELYKTKNKIRENQRKSVVKKGSLNVR